PGANSSPLTPASGERGRGEGTPDAWTLRAQAILQATGVREGYAIVWGIGSGRLLTELARQSDLRLIVIDPDEKKVDALRRQLAAMGLYGERVAVHAGDPLTFPLPPYLASLMVTENLAAAGIEANADFLKKAFHSLRPYGGVACLAIPEGQAVTFARQVSAAHLVNARLKRSSAGVLLVREGALPGSANWTHEHADAANTRVSRDQLVKAPLGLLWFGGPSHEGILPRHGHGPQPQVIDGRLIIEGIDMLRAMDVYTGRVLWEARLPGVGSFYNNLAHQPGANASGGNYVSTSDGIYVVHGKACVRLDPATGKTMSRFQLPAPLTPTPLPPRGGEGKDLLPSPPLRGRGAGGEGAKEPPTWGYINVYEDYLIGGADPLFDPKLAPPITAGGDDPDPADRKPDSGLLAKLKRIDNDNFTSSKHLVIMDRHSGQVRWTATARSGFRHNAICIGGGRLYCIDRLSGAEVGRMKRRGEEPRFKPRLVVFDLRTGKEVWSTEDDVFGTWLSYSAEHDVLVEAGRVARDTVLDEPKGMRAYRASDGKVLWYQKEYLGPAMIHKDTILMAGSACNLLTGAMKMRPDPLTGEPVPWTWSRNYGCNTPAASEHLLTFRSGAAGYLDYCNDGGTGNLGGFRTGCTNSLIVANGVLSAPDYTRTCTCAYQNQTSLALIHMPEAEMWTFFGPSEGKGPIRRLGLNLGAPGDRRADDGTLWLEYPSVAGKSPNVSVSITPAEPEWFRRHASQISGEGLPWVAASGAKGLRSLTVKLAEQADSERCYTVRLHFVEPDRLKPGQRVFSVALQGQEVLKDFDIVKEAGGPNRALVKEFKGVKAANDLRVTLTPTAGEPVLCGIEIVAEGR
ncbi:MAG TPA: PQQ-binding-like beta-propeller repeat protein, partial [Gemmataceae bacterium]|nr:PQQ-binding-like beta-propeller repeat protein [Gemmataceae bacterium]